MCGLRQREYVPTVIPLVVALQVDLERAVRVSGTGHALQRRPATHGAELLCHIARQLEARMAAQDV